MSVSKWFIRMAVVYGLVGMLLGIKMASSNDHSQMPTHAHLMLLGWASMAIFAIIYRIWTELSSSRLATIHYYLHQLGVLGIVIGLYQKLSESNFAASKLYSRFPRSLLCYPLLYSLSSSGKKRIN